VSRREKAIQKLELELLTAQENHRRALDDVRTFEHKTLPYIVILTKNIADPKTVFFFERVNQLCGAQEDKPTNKLTRKGDNSFLFLYLCLLEVSE